MTQYTDITFLIDRSGSMVTIAAEMEGGFASFIEKQKEIPGKCLATLAQFDNEYEVVYTAMPVDDVPPLKIVPRGNTALIDSLGRLINETGARLAAMKEEERPSQVLFVIITDGHENASREFKHQQVADMIKHQQEKYQWDFIFLGANLDAAAVATSLSIPKGNSFTYTANAAGSNGVLRDLSEAVSSYRSLGTKGAKNLTKDFVKDE